MSRLIKVRGKHVDNGDWVYGYLIGGDVIVGEIVEWDVDYFCTEYWYKVDPETVGQYTGLKDKNSNEIYEGDIVENSFSKRDGFCYKVIWGEEEGQWLFDPFMKGDEKAPLLGIEEFLQDWQSVGFDDTLEVIGNCFDHPELF